MTEMVLLGVWLIGLFGLVGGAVYFIYRGVSEDSVRYDELYVWKDAGSGIPGRESRVGPTQD